MKNFIVLILLVASTSLFAQHPTRTAHNQSSPKGEIIMIKNADLFEREVVAGNAYGDLRYKKSDINIYVWSKYKLQNMEGLFKVRMAGASSGTVSKYQWVGFDRGTGYHVYKFSVENATSGRGTNKYRFYAELSFTRLNSEGELELFSEGSFKNSPFEL